MQDIKNPEAAAAAHALIKAILFYGGVTFLTGFTLGVFRELALVPVAGTRGGRWLEFPLLLTVVMVIAYYTVQRLHDRRRKYLLALGIVGMLVMLALESGFALYVMRVPVVDYLASFNIVKGALFPFGLIFMCIAPWAAQRLWIEKQ